MSIEGFVVELVVQIPVDELGTFTNILVIAAVVEKLLDSIKVADIESVEVEHLPDLVVFLPQLSFNTPIHKLPEYSILCHPWTVENLISHF